MTFVTHVGRDRESWLARRDARLKLAWLGAVSLASVLIDSAPALVALCGVTVLVAAGLDWNRRTVLVVGGVVLLVAWSTVLSQAMFFAGEPRTPIVTLVPPWQWGPIAFPGLRLYREGAWYGLLQSSRMVATMLAGLAVCFSTSPERLLAALVWLRMPGALSFMAVAALRLLPVLVDEWSTVRGACRLRGYRPRLLAVGRRAWDSWRTEAALLVPVIAASLRRAQTLATSLTARGFDATQPRTTFPAIRMNDAERAAVVLIVALSVSLAVAKSLFWLSAANVYSTERLDWLYTFARRWL